MKQRLTTYDHKANFMGGATIRFAQLIMGIALIGILISSCSIKDDISGCDNGKESQESQGVTYITVQVQTLNDEETETRATNTSGPSGDKRGGLQEVGYLAENKVDNATLLLYKGNNSDAKNEGNSSSITIEEAYYFDGFEEVTTTADTEDQKRSEWKSVQKYQTWLPLPSSSYSFLIITNAGDKTSYKGKTLKNVKDDILQNAWSASTVKPGDPVSAKMQSESLVKNGSVTIDNFSQFVMTNTEVRSAESNSNVGTTKTTTKDGKTTTTTITYDDKAGTYIQVVTTTDKDGNVVETKKKEYTNETNIGKGTEDDPLVLWTQVQRFAARIDFVNKSVKTKTKKNNESINTYTDEFTYPAYKTTTSSEETGDYFVLTHVMPFNCLKSGSFFLKRLGNKDGSLIEYMKEETLNGGEYVIDPLWSSNKLTNTYGTSFASDNYNLYSSNDKNDASYLNPVGANWENYKVKPSVTVANDDQAYYILTYTQENTSPDNNTAYATGLLFRGIYYTSEEWDADNNKPKANATGTVRTYKYYIRHIDPDDKYDATKPMLYGIVRDNIYRVSIDKVVAPEKEDGEPTLQIKLKVKPWAKYTHDEINM